MEKLIKIIGGEKPNPLGDNELDIRMFFKNIIFILIAAVSMAFTIGTYATAAKRLPERMTAVTLKVNVLERKQEVNAVQLSNMATVLGSIQTDVRDIRRAQLGGNNVR